MGILKNYPPRLCDRPKIKPPYPQPPLPSERDVPPIAKLRTTRISAEMTPIEGFHSRGQHLCKFTRTKESVCIRKDFNSHRIGLGHQHGRRFIVLGNQYGRRDVM